MTRPIPRISDDPLLTPKELGAWLRVSEQALSQLRYRHEGPTFIRFGRSIRYLRSDVEEYVLQRLEGAS